MSFFSKLGWVPLYELQVPISKKKKKHKEAFMNFDFF